MAATFTWSVLDMDCVAQENNNTDVVIKVYWRCVAEQLEGDNTYSTFVDRNTDIQIDENNPFIPYDQLTEAVVLGWVYEKVVTAATEAKDDKPAKPAILIKEATEYELQSVLDLQITPPVIKIPLPWVGSESP